MSGKVLFLDINLPQSVFNRLHELMESKGIERISDSMLKHLGISRQCFNKYLKNTAEMSLLHQYKIAAWLGVDPATLVYTDLEIDLPPMDMKQLLNKHA